MTRSIRSFLVAAAVVGGSALLFQTMSAGQAHFERVAALTGASMAAGAAPAHRPAATALASAARASSTPASRAAAAMNVPVHVAAAR